MRSSSGVWSSGAMRERLVLQKASVRAYAVSSLTRSGLVATAVTLVAHGLSTGDLVRVSGADQAYNGKVKVTVIDTVTVTFACAAGLASPATGAVVLTYLSDAQGGRVEVWEALAEVSGELMPVSASEGLQLGAVQSDTFYRFRVRRRSDVTAKQRIVWSPSWPPKAASVSLEVTGVLPLEDGRSWMRVDCAVAAG